MSKISVSSRKGITIRTKGIVKKRVQNDQSYSSVFGLILVNRIHDRRKEHVLEQGIRPVHNRLWRRPQRCLVLLLRE